MLRDNRTYYDFSLETVKKLYDKGLLSDCVSFIQKISFYSWWNFHGMYYSELFENTLADIGLSLPRFDSSRVHSLQHRKRNILHICSEVHTSGGHSKLLFNWIDFDNTSDHAIVSTRMSHDDFLRISNGYLSPDEYTIFTLSADNILDKAQQLKELLYQGYDLVILHIHPDDALPSLVFSDPNIQIPVLFLNHADHTFWLGSSITDIILETRQINIALDRERRVIDHGFYLPIPIRFPLESAAAVVEQDSRKISILTIGNEAKYVPNSTYNFFESVYRLVFQFENISVNVVGVHENSVFVQQYLHPRINYLGELSHERVESFRKSCDLYLEGFPTPSFTAMLETVAYGKPFVLHYNPQLVYRLFEDSLNHGIIYPKDLNNWEEEVKRMITDVDYRADIKEKQTRFIFDEFSLHRWKERLTALYQMADITTHKISRPICQRTYESENEKLVSSSFSAEIDHLQFTESLPFLFKISYLFNKHCKDRNIKKIKLKSILIYFLPKSLRKFLKNFRSKL